MGNFLRKFPLTPAANRLRWFCVKILTEKFSRYTGTAKDNRTLSSPVYLVNRIPVTRINIKKRESPGIARGRLNMARVLDDEAMAGFGGVVFKRVREPAVKIDRISFFKIIPLSFYAAD